METTFSIEFSMKTREGLESFATFSVGNKREKAYAIFNQLKGEPDVTEKDILFIDLIETAAGLPVNLKMISCTLNQLTKNCRIITRELFKLKNIEGGGSEVEI
ncbi:MAG TPA: hypothetical protein VGQ53_03625 [Chitinophagaceae bacterium]|jgi:hypothetical protein|nr:hypothetical protein [Chitinophagaceae bacterium]